MRHDYLNMPDFFSSLHSLIGQLCSVPQLPDHLRFVDLLFEDGNLTAIKFDCDQGQLEGNDTVTCNDGVWAGGIPTCVTGMYAGYCTCTD